MVSKVAVLLYCICGLLWASNVFAVHLWPATAAATASRQAPGPRVQAILGGDEGPFC